MPPSRAKKKTAVAHVEAIAGSLPPTHEWDERERALLDLARKQAADIDALEADIAEWGVRIENRGAVVLNQALGEVRQERVALARLLGQIDIPGSASGRTVHARKGAEARWKPKAA